MKIVGINHTLLRNIASTMYEQQCVTMGQQSISTKFQVNTVSIKGCEKKETEMHALSNPYQRKLLTNRPKSKVNGKICTQDTHQILNKALEI